MDNVFCVKKHLFLCLFFAAVCFQVSAEYPLIEQLNNFNDPRYRQQQQDVELFYRSRGDREKFPDLIIFRYKIREHDTLFSLASAFNLTYETIATLNNMDNPEDWPDDPISPEYLLMKIPNPTFRLFCRPAQEIILSPRCLK